MSCVFCTNVRDAGEVVEEDESTWLVRHPRGHVMLVAKRHAANVSDLDEDEWLRVARAWHRYETKLRADRVMFMKLGIKTPHLHVHLYPFAEDVMREDVFAAFDRT